MLSWSRYLITQPLERFHWKVLPQGMLNSPTICQHFVHKVIKPVRDLFPQSLIYHYMDDILIASVSQEELKQIYLCLRDNICSTGLLIAPERIQHFQPWQYLGYVLFHHMVRPQVVQIQVPNPFDTQQFATTLRHY